MHSPPDEHNCSSTLCGTGHGRDDHYYREPSSGLHSAIADGGSLMVRDPHLKLQSIEQGLGTRDFDRKAWMKKPRPWF
jgi:hypothetical protein